MGCGEFLVKYILFFANLFFALSGLALLGIGIAVQLQIAAITNVIDGSVQVAPISAMAIGGIVFLIAFFGCCGAIRESNCMLTTYAIFMLVLMILKIALATAIFVNMDSLLVEVPRVLNEAFNRDQESFHAIEKTFECCGTTGPLSYNNVTLPPSCCAQDAMTCTVLNSYGGCNDKVKDFFSTFGMVIGIVAIAVGAVELVAVIFGLCLANHVRNRDRRSQY